MANKKKKSLKEILSTIWGYIKRPAFFIPFAITYCGLESPFIYGGIAYLITNQDIYWQIALGWLAITAPALPIPVIPISTAVGVAVERIINKIKEKKKHE